MGQDKAQLKLANSTALSQAVNLLEELHLDSVVVSGNYIEYASIIDIHENAGPLGGIYACLDALRDKCDALFILPVDMPLLTKSECLQLLKAFNEYPQGVYFKQSTFPLILPINNQLQHYLTETLHSQQKKQRSLYRLIKTLNIQAITPVNNNSFRFYNSNTPEEWEQCKAIHDKLHSN